MKNDPYSSLGGLDQRLFNEGARVTTPPRDNEPTLARDNAPPKEPASEPTQPRASEPAKQGTSERSRPRRIERAPQRTLEPARTPASARTGHRISGRIDARHSHDIFQDQVRWMNRMKLELEETYEKKVTGNEMVQLAIDRLIADYQARGDDSAVMRVLVFGEPWTEEAS